MFSRNDIGFIIRFHYSQNDSRFFERYLFFKSYVLPAIKSQTYSEFDIYVWTNPFHEKLFKDLGCNTFYGSDTRKYNSRGYYHDFIPYSQTTGLPKLKIQFGLDSDDIIRPQYVYIAVEKIKHHCLKYPNKSLHLCFQPELLYWKNKRKQTMRKYSTRNGSAFMCLYQPTDNDWRFIYEESHLSIIRKADYKEVLPSGFCYAVAHQLNETTGKSQYEIQKNKIVLV